MKPKCAHCDECLPCGGGGPLALDGKRVHTKCLDAYNKKIAGTTAVNPTNKISGLAPNQVTAVYAGLKK
jgi:hypothetical protein